MIISMIKKRWNRRSQTTVLITTTIVILLTAVVMRLLYDWGRIQHSLNSQRRHLVSTISESHNSLKQKPLVSALQKKRLVIVVVILLTLLFLLCLCH